jgi:hypothetical protein
LSNLDLIIVSLLVGVDNDVDRAELRHQIAAARTVGEYMMNFEGKLVTQPKVGLPAPLK